MAVVVGLDVGGTKTNATVLTEDGRFLVDDMVEVMSCVLEGPTAAIAANWEASTALMARSCRAPNANEAKPSTSHTPTTTTNGTAARVRRQRPMTSSGTAIAATPTTRGGSAAQAMPRS